MTFIIFYEWIKDYILCFQKHITDWWIKIKRIVFWKWIKSSKPWLLPVLPQKVKFKWNFPGPCPPCPKTVKTICYCGKKGPDTRRCSSKYWSCGQSCGKLLGCGEHPCQASCHEGECQPCPRQSLQKCRCGGSSKLRPCAEPDWQCDKVRHFIVF